MRPRLLILCTGGTISSVDDGEGLRPRGGGAAATLPGLGALTDRVEVVVEPVLSVSSGAMGLPEMGQIADRIRSAQISGFAGIVVTHGTDTIADTAFVLSVLGPWLVPVVLTGAMRAAGQPGSDAVRNLLDAVTVASCTAAHELGVVLVMDGVVTPGPTAEKESWHSSAAFVVPDGGPLGYVSEGSLWLRHRVRRFEISQALDPRQARPVAAMVALPGDRGEQLRLCASRFDGLVIAGLGGGHVAPQSMQALEEVARVKPVVVCSSYPAAISLSRTYAGPGSEQAISDAGAYGGWSLSARKAALVLSMILGGTSDRQRIKTTLEEVSAANAERVRRASRIHQ